MGLVGVQENGAGDLGFPGVSLGAKNKYKRMDSELNEDLDDHHHQGDASSSARKYVYACAVFASLNSVLLGYGMFSSSVGRSNRSRLLNSFVRDFSD